MCTTSAAMYDMISRKNIHYGTNYSFHKQKCTVGATMCGAAMCNIGNLKNNIGSLRFIMTDIKNKHQGTSYSFYKQEYVVAQKYVTSPYIA